MPGGSKRRKESSIGIDILIFIKKYRISFMVRTMANFAQW
jgi:hypothetical protein